jgi:hypothetical protein
MTETVDVHDLPEEQASLVQEFVEFLRRRRQKNKQTLKEEKEKNKEWSKLAMTSFAKDWENEKDAVYDRWREHYHVPER